MFWSKGQAAAVIGSQPAPIRSLPPRMTVTTGVSVEPAMSLIVFAMTPPLRADCVVRPACDSLTHWSTRPADSR